jgi:hypothetical protein
MLTHEHRELNVRVPLREQSLDPKRDAGCH